MTNTFERMRERYRQGSVPWDEPDPPPEVIELASTLDPGLALDVGCGYGRAAIHLARQGWSVDAVDFIPEALSVARQRAAEAGVAERIRFTQATAPDLGQFTGPYDLILDVGCGHALEAERLADYVGELARLTPPGGTVAWFVRLREPDSALGDVPLDADGGDELAEETSSSGPRGIVEDELRQRLADHFTVEAVEYGRSGAHGAPNWPSAWFWLRRRSG